MASIRCYIVECAFSESKANLQLPFMCKTGPKWERYAEVALFEFETLGEAGEKDLPPSVLLTSFSKV
jgi:hypothetical protein